MLAFSSASVLLPFVADKGKAADYCRKPVSMGCQLTWNISHNADVTHTYSDWLDGDSQIGRASCRERVYVLV